MHCRNGSPVIPLGHTQIGLWLITRHFAWIPQAPSQGSLHFWLIQASSVRHSELITHSGLQFGGMPINSDWQVQTAWSLFSRHIELGPHGDGVHGFTGVGAKEKTKNRIIRDSMNYKYELLFWYNLRTLWISLNRTLCVRIAYETLRARAQRRMIDYLTNSVQATSSRA